MSNCGYSKSLKYNLYVFIFSAPEVFDIDSAISETDKEAEKLYKSKKCKLNYSGNRIRSTPRDRENVLTLSEALGALTEL